MIAVMLFTLGMTFAVVLVVTFFLALALGSLVLNVGFDVFPFFAGFFPGDLAALDGFGELSPGLGDELVAAAFFFTPGFTFFFSLGLSLVATLGVFLLTTLAPGRFPGFLGLQAFSVTIDGAFESFVGVFLGELAFLDKLLEILLHFPKSQPSLYGRPSFCGVFPGDLAALDGLGEFFSGGIKSGAAVFLFALGLTPVPGSLFAILGCQSHRNSEENSGHNS